MQRTKPAGPTTKLGATDLLAFKAITSFITELGKYYGKNQRSLALYARLIEKTNISHEQNIVKHVDAFKGFCVKNREAIVESRVDLLKTNVINFSSNVFVNIAAILKIAETDDIPVVWEHLVTISSILDPEGGQKKVVHSKETQDLKDSIQGKGKEDNLLRDIIDTVGVSLGKGEKMESTSRNPDQAVSDILNNGSLTNIMKSMTEGMEKGDLDLTKLMGSIQGMVSNMQGVPAEKNKNIPPELAQMTNSLNTMITSVSESVNRFQQNN